MVTFEPVVAASVTFVWWNERRGWLGLLGAGLIINYEMVLAGVKDGQP